MRRITAHGAIRRAKHYGFRARQMGVDLLTTGSIYGIRSKHCADFVNYLARQGGRQDSGFPDLWRTYDWVQTRTTSRIAVVINCYYVDLMDELLEQVSLIPVPFDVYVTNVSDQDVRLPETLGNMRRGIVVDCENRGRDILPMIHLVNSGVLDQYDLILKVHTKKSPWREQHTQLSGSGENWRGVFLDSLLASEDNIARIIASFADDSDLGVVTAPGSIVGKEFWGGDERIVRQLLRRIELGVTASALRFPSGSMYWCRGFVLQGLRCLNLIADDFDEEAGQVDGTTAHAVERIVGILSEEAGLHMVSTDELEPVDDRRDILIESFQPQSRVEPRASVVPFYLPQFHPSPHNDIWWGKGFTEWTNVASAVPAFQGHYQPKIPTDLGFYDLRIDDVRREQAELASSHGIAGFMYYYYWFSGERLLNVPIESLLASDTDFPFCIMWANENWTRRWDGRSQDILIGQDYDKVPAEDFIDDVMEFLLDPRYMRVDGKALLAVYRPGQMMDFGAVANEWRRRAREAGVGELLLISVEVAQDFDAVDKESRDEIDGTLEFPPHNLPWVAGPAESVGFDSRWRGNFMSYQATAEASIIKAREGANDRYPGVMVNFDNTARRQWRPEVWYGANPYTFRRWLGAHINSVMVRESSERIVFINAWNEWAEGAILEPTTKFGRTFLLAVKDAVR